MLREQLKEWTDCKSFNKCDDNSAQAYVVTARNYIHLWHCRLGPVPHEMIVALQKATTGMSVVNKVQVERCVDCLLGKKKRLSFRRRLSWRAIQPLEIVHSDLFELISVTSVRWNKY